MLAALLCNLQAAPPPPPPAAGPRGGAPIWWVQRWTDEDERELAALKHEEQAIEVVLAKPAPAALKRPGIEQARITRAFAELERVRDAIAALEAKRDDDDTLESFGILLMLTE